MVHSDTRIGLNGDSGSVFKLRNDKVCMYVIAVTLIIYRQILNKKRIIKSRLIQTIAGTLMR